MNKKIALVLFLFILFIILGLVFSNESFIDKLITLIEKTDSATARNIAEKMENPETTANPPTASGPDWWLQYTMPSCYDPGEMEPIQEMRAIRVHWKELIKDAPFKGTYLADDSKIIYTGTFDGKNLTFSDTLYGPTITTQVYFSENFSDLRGGYEILSNTLNIPGCPNGTILAGGVTGTPMTQK